MSNPVGGDLAGNAKRLGLPIGELRVRARDATGTVQTSTEAPPVPDGASGWDEVEVS